MVEIIFFFPNAIFEGQQYTSFVFKWNNNDICTRIPEPPASESGLPIDGVLFPV